MIADTQAQVAAGAHMLDVNAGIPLADEPAILAETVKLVQSLTDVPLSIDSSIVAALEAGLAVYQGKPLVNSVTGEDDRIESVLPLVAKHGAAVVAITNDETGISEDPDVRFAVAEKIVRAAADHGIAPHDIVVDPLVMPVGAMGTAGRQVFALVRRLHDELGVNTTCGASNVSFGLPNRNGLNGAFLAMAIANGMTSAITSPLHEEVRQAVMAADVLMGTDAHAEVVDPPLRRRPEPGRRRRRHAGAGAARAGARAQRPTGSTPPACPRWRPSRDRRAGFARRLHAVGQARPVRRRHEPARRRALARRRPRLGLRRARHLWALPGRRGRRRVRQARHHLARRPPHGRSASRRRAIER